MQQAPRQFAFCVLLLLALLVQNFGSSSMTQALTASNLTPVSMEPQSALPTSIDNSQTPWFPPIGVQNHGCTAFSVGYYIKTFQEAKEHGWDLTGAKWEGYIAGIDCGHPTHSYQDKIMTPAFIDNLNFPNGSIETAMQIAGNIGVSTWATMPYDGYHWTDWPSEQAWTEAALYRGESTYQTINLTTDNGLENLKSLLVSQNLASIYINSSALRKENFVAGDLLTLDNYNISVHNHVNTIVGYDDAISYTENGNTHYGAFKIANSWGVGVINWENVPDGFYWISYEAMKQQFKTCFFINDLIGYQPDLLASFKIEHAKRSDTSITISAGSAPLGSVTKRLSSYVSGYPYPYTLNDYLSFPNNNIVLDITEFKNYLPSIVGQTFWLSVYDGGSQTTGNITNFAIISPSGYQETTTVPTQTINNNYVHLSLNYNNPGPSPTPMPTPTPTSIALTPLPTSKPTQPTPTPTPTSKPTIKSLPTLIPTTSPIPTLSPTTTLIGSQAQTTIFLYVTAAAIGIAASIGALALVFKVRHRKKAFSG
jgi:hypothetical protein